MGPAVQYTEPLTQQHPHITFTTCWHPLPHREQNYYSSKVLMIISVTVESRQKPCQEQSCNTKQCNCRSLAFTCNLVTGPQYSLCLGPRSRRRRPAEVARCPFVVVVVVVVVVVWLLSASGCGVLGYCCLWSWWGVNPPSNLKPSFNILLLRSSLKPSISMWCVCVLVSIGVQVYSCVCVCVCV